MGKENLVKSAIEGMLASALQEDCKDEGLTILNAMKTGLAEDTRQDLKGIGIVDADSRECALFGIIVRGSAVYGIDPKDASIMAAMVIGTYREVAEKL